MPNPSIQAIILAAGQGRRLAQAGIKQKKQFLPWQGLPLFWHSALVFSRIASISGITFVFPEQELSAGKDKTRKLEQASSLGIPWQCVVGGARRQDSVYLGLQALPQTTQIVLVHDAARPFLSAKLVTSMLTTLTSDLDGIIPGLPVKDTIKEVQDDLVINTPKRSSLMAVQTPQTFYFSRLLQAHKQARQENWQVTDDASIIEKSGGKIKVIAGEAGNIKITTIDDLNMLQDSTPAPLPCTGYGYDVHKYGGERPLILGGIPIPGKFQVKAHSDGDVLLHALADALLGCLGQGDIGQYFPDTNPNLDNMSSAIIISKVMDMVYKAQIQLTHVDLTVIAQVPKLGPHKHSIRKNVSTLLKLDPQNINIKATTEEGLGFTGAKQGIKAVAVVTALKPYEPRTRENINANL